MERTKTYFVSDAHFGVDTTTTSEYREEQFIKWLDAIKADAAELYLLGDIFDFWFEYTYVVPRGFVLVLAKLKELADSGIKITYFTGNHDMWIFDYLPKVINAELVRNPEVRIIGGKSFYLGHGDGLGRIDRKYNMMKWMFANRFFQFLFKWIHPDWGYRLGLWCSKTSRKRHILPKHPNYEREYHVKFARAEIEKKHYDYFVFGHRHIPYQHKIDENVLVTNVGDWLFNFSYAVFDGEKLELLRFVNVD